MDKLNELTLGEKIIVAAGVVLLIDSFLPWYSIDISIFHFSRNGWQAPNSFLSVLAILIGIAMAAQVLVARLGSVNMPDKVGSLGWGMVDLIAGAVAFLFVIIKWLNNTDWTAYGLYIGIIATAALAFGGFTVAKERGDFPATRPGGAPGGPSL